MGIENIKLSMFMKISSEFLGIKVESLGFVTGNFLT